METPDPARSPRERARKAYRVITVVAAVLLLLAGLGEMGMLDDLAGPNGPLYTIAVVLMFGTVFAAIWIAIFALWYSFKLGGDWRMALPCWLYTAGALLIAVDLKFTEGTADLWNPALVFFGASLLAAAWAAWSPRRNP